MKLETLIVVIYNNIEIFLAKDYSNSLISKLIDVKKDSFIEKLLLVNTEEDYGY
jgi:hypothetical protein